MIFNWRSGDAESPARAFDANGLEIVDRVFRLDTDTGELWCWKEEDGFLMVDPISGEMVEVKKLMAAPIRVRFGERSPNHPPMLPIKYVGCTCKEWQCMSCPVCGPMLAKRTAFSTQVIEVSPTSEWCDEPIVFEREEGA